MLSEIKKTNSGIKINVKNASTVTKFIKKTVNGCNDVSLTRKLVFDAFQSIPSSFAHLHPQVLTCG